MAQRFINKRLRFPTTDDVTASIYALLILGLTYRIHPIEFANGQLGNYQTKARLTFDDVTDIIHECNNSKQSLFEFENTANEEISNDIMKTTHYATTIEWLEAAKV